MTLRMVRTCMWRQNRVNVGGFNSDSSTTAHACGAAGALALAAVATCRAAGAWRGACTGTALGRTLPRPLLPRLSEGRGALWELFASVSSSVIARALWHATSREASAATRLDGTDCTLLAHLPAAGGVPSQAGAATASGARRAALGCLAAADSSATANLQAVQLLAGHPGAGPCS